MDKDTLRAIEIINDILEDLTIVANCGIGWKNGITAKRQDLDKIIKDNKGD